MDTVKEGYKLAKIENLDEWGESCPKVSKKERSEIVKIAEPLWLERMIINEKLLVHPEILVKLKSQSWVPNDLQKRMIWASVIASMNGKDSKDRFKKIKQILLKKYGRDWWEDVFQRKTNAWAAKERIRKCTGPDSPVLSTLINNTILFGSAAQDERIKALQMIPSK